MCRVIALAVVLARSSGLRLLILSMVGLSTIACDAPDDGDDADAGGDAADGGGTITDWIAQCESAGNEGECRAIQLPELGCCDAWHTCSWFTLYPTSEMDGACSYGEPEGRCLYFGGGEGGSASLIRYCDRPNDSWASLFWIDSGGELLLGFSQEGGTANTTRCELDDQGRPAAGSPPECACPCRPGYPAAECETVGGVERCNGVPAHRVDDAPCPDPGDCTSDVDCMQGEVCLCAHGGNDGERASVCVTAECRTDTDCPADQVCAVSYESPDQRGCVPATLACRTPHEFCDGTVCDTNDPCVYDPGAPSWSCQAGQCG